jgi:pimeloyl-ACP methyl ester carboxylesterase
MLKLAARALFGLAALVALLLASGLGYEAVSAGLDARRFDPPGRMVDVGGHRLNIVCMGEAQGPTVVIEAGSGVGAVGYAAVQERIAQFARVCSYDRAGFGWSEPTRAQRTFEAYARELDLLLAGAEEPGHYILVAHSWGGGVVRVFAREHPEKTAGLVLIETGDEELAFHPVAQAAFARAQEINRVAAVLHRFGVIRLVPALLGPYADAPDEVRARVLRPGTFASMAGYGEAIDAIPEERRRFGGLGTLGDLPLVVVVRGRADMGSDPAFEQVWRAANRRLAELSTNSTVIVAEQSGHMVHVEQPEVYVDAVRRLVAAVADGARLAAPE